MDLSNYCERLKIKKGKIRGEVSNGMLCGPDEVGLGVTGETGIRC